MKLATIEADGGHGHVGVVVGDGDLLDLAAFGGHDAAAAAVPRTMRKLLAAGDAALDAVRDCAARVGAMSADEQAGFRRDSALVAWDDVAFRAPVPNPAMVLSVGMNYRRHLAEMSNTPVPKYPTAFQMAGSALTGSGQPIILPRQFPDMVDFEGEFCFVFGRACHNVGATEAMDYVAGYTIANDVSARDWVADVFGAEKPFPAIAAWDRNLLGKQLPTFCPCGPVIATKDEITNPHDLQLTLTLNGEVMQSTRTDDLVFTLPEIIAYFSQWYQFRAGDIVTTGSPAGVGVGRDPKVFMQAGDTVEVTVEGVGTLTNPVVAAGD